MPTNIGSEALSTMKLGEAAVDKAYVGVDQIFPNETEITAAAYDNASIGNTGGNGILFWHQGTVLPKTSVDRRNVRGQDSAAKYSAWL